MPDFAYTRTLTIVKALSHVAHSLGDPPLGYFEVFFFQVKELEFLPDACFGRQVLKNGSLADRLDHDIKVRLLFGSATFLLTFLDISTSISA